MALQVAEKPRIASEVRKKHVAGAEARADFGALAARLKSCPVTELRRISGGLSFSAACLAPAGELLPVEPLSLFKLK